MAFSIMKIYICLLLGLFLTFQGAFGQSSGPAKSSTPITVGAELDMFPYLTGGYYGSLWVGSNHVRARGVITRATLPGFVTEDGFEDNQIDVYAAIVDYFIHPDFQGLWIGGGIEYWNGNISLVDSPADAGYDNFIATLGVGYVWKFWKNLYLNPWAAVHVRVAGDDEVIVSNEQFNPRAVLPEASLKLGWHF